MEGTRPCDKSSRRTGDPEEQGGPRLSFKSLAKFRRGRSASTVQVGQLSKAERDPLDNFDYRRSIDDDDFDHRPVSHEFGDDMLAEMREQNDEDDLLPLKDRCMDSNKKAGKEGGRKKSLAGIFADPLADVPLVPHKASASSSSQANRVGSPPVLRAAHTGSHSSSGKSAGSGAVKPKSILRCSQTVGAATQRQDPPLNALEGAGCGKEQELLARKSWNDSPTLRKARTCSQNGGSKSSSSGAPAGASGILPAPSQSSEIRAAAIAAAAACSSAVANASATSPNDGTHKTDHGDAMEDPSSDRSVRGRLGNLASKLGSLTR